MTSKTNAPHPVQADIERAVLENLTAALPAAVHSAVQQIAPFDRRQQSRVTTMGRKVRNGVREPAPGGKCHQVWTELDALKAATKTDPTLAQALALVSKGVNENNARIEFYNWKRFHAPIARTDTTRARTRRAPRAPINNTPCRSRGAVLAAPRGDIYINLDTLHST